MPTSGPATRAPGLGVDTTSELAEVPALSVVDPPVSLLVVDDETSGSLLRATLGLELGLEHEDDVGEVAELRLTIAELREHNERLRRQRDELLRLQREKEQLIACVVHDLKSPVNALALHAQLLFDGTMKARECSLRMQAAVRQLNRMILDLLDVSKADAGQLNPQRIDVDLRSLVDELFSELEVSARKRRVSLRSSLETHRVHADPDLLRRTLTNLVENAIRVAPPETSVTIAAARRVEETELRVLDAGPGISFELRELVFEPFVQVDACERPVARGSHGLGLTFCKLAIKAHGGRIWIEDADPGTAFCMTLPHGR